MRRIVLLCMALSLLGWNPPARAAGQADEAQVKAAYLYNFAKFIHWPDEAFAGPESALVIGVLGKNAIEKPLRLLQGKSIQNHPIEIQVYSQLSDIGTCHILYLPSTAIADSTLWREALSSKAVVSVSDSRRFAAKGGIIELIPVRGRLRFIINLGMAKDQQLKVGSQLLSLAIEVLRERS